MNPYESGAQKNIPAVLLYVFSRFADGSDRVLMIHRNAKDRPGDFHAGKWNGLGGKCEVNESFVETASRELEEESTLRIPPSEFSFSGFLQFPNFKPHRHEDWSCMVFRAEVPESVALSVPPTVDEGSLHWIQKERLLELNLWNGDRNFLPYVIERRPFTGAIWYIDGVAARSEVRPV
jgi:8-oxo-dGTP diphosphatase